MRTFTTEYMVNETIELIAQYVYKMVEKIMIGEVRSTSVNIFTYGSRENDVFARTKLKNQEVISLYRVDIWLEDIMRLCRKNKIFLVTKEIFPIVVLYYIIHPLFTTKFMECPGPGEIYSSIYVAATERARRVIEHHTFKLNYIQNVVLRLLTSNDYVLANYNPDGELSMEEKLRTRNIYRDYMLKHHRQAYLSAVKFKANYFQVDENGFMRLERINCDVDKTRIVEREIEFGQSLGICINPKVNWE